MDKKAEDMEAEINSGNVRRLFQPIRATGFRRPTVNESIKDQQGVLISSKGKRLERWMEHIENQFSFPPTAVQANVHPTPEPCLVSYNPLQFQRYAESFQA